MKKIKLPFLTSSAYRLNAESLLKHLKPSVEKVGAPPGTLTYTGREAVETKINLFQYEKNEISFNNIDSIDDLKKNYQKDMSAG